MFELMDKDLAPSKAPTMQPQIDDQQATFGDHYISLATEPEGDITSRY